MAEEHDIADSGRLVDHRCSAYGGPGGVRLVGHDNLHV